ncbi:hypothetical protein [Streptomyces olivochromogenes]|uniref:Uncharacterized protein n=1 Tax=Streptomyces olivochromogenes TaxID=1963 RepID=A0A250V4L6_STROL|nr:hypothetical protein [Streptomyces olivochromogenes]KUN49485.1 hypothetical protein AQJ27_02990 [Streptomyces olivochromogenes]GAX49113.1 hypothetical protein SO3561_00599 [Streptomyces olivochromogenes]
MTFSAKTKSKMSPLSRLARRSVPAAALLAGTALAAPTAQAEPAAVRAAPVPDLVCRLDAEVNFSPPLSVRVKEAEVTGHIGYLDCRSPSGAAPELTDIVFGVDGTGRFGVLPPTFSVEGNGVGTWNTGEVGSLYFKGDLKQGSPVPDRTVTSGPLAGDGINGLQIPTPRLDKITPDGVAGFDVIGQVCFWPGEKGRCTAF